VAGASPQVAILVKKLSGFAGHDQRGRMYIPGLGEAAIDDDGGISAAKLADLQSAFSQFLTDVNLGTPEGMVIFHTDALTAPTKVTQLQVDPRVATQRRRLR
jgi:hypothetical protein